MTIELALAAASSSSASSSRAHGGGMPAGPCTALPPGFRFHPTDEELILHYLRKRAAAAPCPAPVIAEVDIYKFDPWDLPGKAVFGEAEWYFFSPRDRKYPNGVRPNRSAGSGYWKATGTDKPITLSAAAGDGRDMIGVKKALVFYRGRPPKGMKTNWIMHEYRLAEALAAANAYRPMRFKNSSMRLDDWVLCRIYKKASPPLYSSSPPLDDAEPSMDGAIGYGYGHGQGQQQYNCASADHFAAAAYAPAGRLPRQPSVSDYLVDYSAVSELFEALPPATSQLATDAGSSGAGSLAPHNSHKRRMEEDYSMEATMPHPSNKRLSSSSDASTAVNSYTMFGFGPDQSSHQDRI